MFITTTKYGAIMPIADIVETKDYNNIIIL